MRLTTIAVAGAALLSIPATASAHHGQAVCDQQRAELVWTLTDFGKRDYPVTLTINGSPAWTIARGQPLTVRLPVAPGSQVTADANWPTKANGGSFVPFADVCGTPPLPETDDNIAAPQSSVSLPVSPPPVVNIEPLPPQREVGWPPRLSCADLRKAGAGRKWLVKFGCVKPRPKPRVTCALLRKRGAGMKWKIRFGCVPETGRHPRPPVAG